MSIFVEPLLDQLKLIGEEDPEEPIKLKDIRESVDQPEDKGFFDHLLEYMDSLFLKHPRSVEIDLSADITSKRLSNLEESLKMEAVYENSEELTTSENVKDNIQGEERARALDNHNGNDKGTAYAP